MIDTDIVTIILPAFPPGNEADSPQHIDMSLNLEQRTTLQGLYDALHTRPVLLKNNRHVDSRADAIRWLLETIATAHTRA